MPTLASVNENSGGPLRLATYQPSLQPRRNVRRCLFGKVSDEDRKRIDDWLKTELELHSAEKSIKWGFDFANDAPSAAVSNADDQVLVQFHQEDDPSGLTNDDFEWLPCRADSVPEFYHSSHGKAKSLKPPVKLAFKQREDDSRTPVKKKSCKKAVQQIPCTSHLPSPSAAAEEEELSFAAISSGSEEESAATDLLTARESYPVDAGFSPAAGASILAVESSQIADTTPQRPGEPSFSSASSSRNSFNRATTTGSANRRSQGSDQTKLTSFYQLRKRSHRLSAGEKIGSVEDHVINKGAKRETSVGVELTSVNADLPMKIPRSSYSSSSRN